MTDDELIGIAAQAFNMARLDIKRGSFTCLLANYHDQGKLHRMSRIETLIVQKLGEGWLNSGPGKDAAFSVLREACDRMPPEAFVFASATNVFQTTDKFKELEPAAQEAMLESDSEDRMAAVERGLMTVMDSLTVTAQTAERCCFYVQAVDAKGEPVDQPRVNVIPQDGFKGRLKMYGSREDQEKYFHGAGFFKRKETA